MKAQLIDVGRNKVNKIIIVDSVRNLHKEIGRHILAKGWDMEKTENEDEYVLFSGWNSVGKVKILEH